MVTWEEFLLKASDLADAAGRKVNDVTETAVQKLEIADNERAIRLAIEALGGMLYDSRKENAELNEELVAELIAQVDELTAANERLQAEIDYRRGCKTCVCGSKNPENAAFCNACGKKLR